MYVGFALFLQSLYCTSLVRAMLDMALSLFVEQKLFTALELLFWQPQRPTKGSIARAQEGTTHSKNKAKCPYINIYIYICINIYIYIHTYYTYILTYTHIYIYICRTYVCLIHILYAYGEYIYIHYVYMYMWWTHVFATLLIDML